ncbi:hypothetical protein RRG08_055064 [Elysia crispata]|uniref:Uncharacterized protein n=1 Tax=Elysia crispata TaxID=231223 RepID=A0AAE1E8Q4_9GAST|nr:hypothetical protein RRG08_055064 [Elysia crispata]
MILRIKGQNTLAAGYSTGGGRPWDVEIWPEFKQLSIHRQFSCIEHKNMALTFTTKPGHRTLRNTSFAALTPDVTHGPSAQNPTRWPRWSIAGRRREQGERTTQLPSRNGWSSERPVAQLDNDRHLLGRQRSVVNRTE